MMLALLEEDSEDSDSDGELDGESKEGGAEKKLEWIEVMKKHRIQASRLELLASGVGTGPSGRGLPNKEASPISPTAVS